MQQPALGSWHDNQQTFSPREDGNGGSNPEIKKKGVNMKCDSFRFIIHIDNKYFKLICNK